METLDEATEIAWLTLLNLEHVGPRTLNPLLENCPDPQQLLRHPPAEAGDALRQKLKSADLSKAEQDYVWLKANDCQLIPIGSALYPDALYALHDAPTALFVRGRHELLDMPQLAIVGSRNASRSGCDTTQQFARFLASHGITITSGLAMGVDGAAHQGALQGEGSTIAVLGTGLDRVYPARHRDLAHQIAEHGLLVSEFPPGTPPTPGNFPRRNRIIAGLSLGTLVVEAALKSGSLITARLSTELGREVFAIPGSIHNPLARGCHALIRDGAKLVESGEHIVEELGAQLGELARRSAPDEVDSESTKEAIDPDHQTLLDAMGNEPISTDELVINSGFRAEEVASMLLLLELQGHVLSESGGLFTRKARLH